MNSKPTLSKEHMERAFSVLANLGDVPVGERTGKEPDANRKPQRAMITEEMLLEHTERDVDGFKDLAELVKIANVFVRRYNMDEHTACSYVMGIYNIAANNYGD